MKRIGLISDVHGNLPALQKALEYLTSLPCDEIIHTGDVVDIGPQSRQCLELLLQHNVLCLLGNHDRDFILDATAHKALSHVSAAHKKQVFQTLEGCRAAMEKFPLFVERICGGKKIVFEHYCRLDEPAQNGYVFHTITKPSAQAFDQMYANYNCDAVFFGHKHEPCDIVGQRVYVDIGSVGCHPEPYATGVVLQYDDTSWSYSRFAVPYNQSQTKQRMLNGLADGKYLYNFYFLHKPEGEC